MISEKFDEILQEALRDISDAANDNPASIYRNFLESHLFVELITEGAAASILEVIDLVDAMLKKEEEDEAYLQVLSHYCTSLHVFFCHGYRTAQLLQREAEVEKT